MPAVPLADITRYLDGYLDTARVPDYPNALNGLQVEGPHLVSRFAVAVDAREAVIEAVKDRADLLIVHHGLFWGGLQPLTGPHFRRVKALIDSGTALYSAHLPLDGHPEAGNAVVLARELGLENIEPFGNYEGFRIGCRGTVGQGAKGAAGVAGDDPAGEGAKGAPEVAGDGPAGEGADEAAGVAGDGPVGPGADPGLGGGVARGVALPDFAARLSEVLGRTVTVLPGGPDTIATVAIATGGGASKLAEAAAAEVDVLVTGEAQHHHAIDASELGVTILLGGHYETETWGVRKISELLTDRFGLEGWFVDIPSGL